VQVDLSSGSERLLVRAHDLAAAGDEAAMSDEERKLRERKRLVSKGILSFQSVPANPDRILIPYQQHLVSRTTDSRAPSRAHSGGRVAVASFVSSLSTFFIFRFFFCPPFSISSIGDRTHLVE